MFRVIIERMKQRRRSINNSLFLWIQDVDGDIFRGEIRDRNLRAYFTTKRKFLRYHAVAHFEVFGLMYDVCLESFC